MTQLSLDQRNTLRGILRAHEQVKREGREGALWLTVPDGSNHDLLRAWADRGWFVEREDARIKDMELRSGDPKDPLGLLSLLIPSVFEEVPFVAYMMTDQGYEALSSGEWDHD